MPTGKIDIKDIVWPGNALKPPEGIPEKRFLRVSFMEEDPYVMLDPPSATCLSNKGVFCRLKASDGFGYFLIDVGFPVLHSGPENFKKTRQKNS